MQYNIVLVNTRGKRGSRSRNALGAAERLHSASCALPEQRDAHLFPKHFSRASGGGGGGRQKEDRSKETSSKTHFFRITARSFNVH